MLKLLKHYGYQRVLASMAYKSFDKNPAGSGVNTHANDEKTAKELQKAIINFFKKRTVYSGFKDNIWGADLGQIQSISKFNIGFRFLLWVIYIFSKYAWVSLWKIKKS